VDLSENRVPLINPLDDFRILALQNSHDLGVKVHHFLDMANLRYPAKADKFLAA
jgi:hypothetical protein